MTAVKVAVGTEAVAMKATEEFQKVARAEILGSRGDRDNKGFEVEDGKL
jgi:hypothetical protein